MDNLRIENYLKIIFLICLIAIISAYFIEYILGHQPCNLCLIERIPYGLAMILIIFNYTYKKKEYLVILLLILVFISSVIISFYHFGIEQGFFQESAFCSSNTSSEIISKEELLRQLQVKTISCKDVTFKIFGFSLTTINIIISLIIIFVLTKIFINYEKLKK